MKPMLCGLVLCVAFAAQLLAADDPYASLRLYDGSWEVRNGSNSAKPDRLTDHCTLVGTYFVCQQSVNGKVGALLVFVPTATPGHFYTDNVLPDGRSTGRGDLTIDGDRWTYNSKGEREGKTTWYRTVNVFTGSDRIHSEGSESADGEHWTVKRSNDLVRVR